MLRWTVSGMHGGDLYWYAPFDQASRWIQKDSIWRKTKTGSQVSDSVITKRSTQWWIGNLPHIFAFSNSFFRWPTKWRILKNEKHCERTNFVTGEVEKKDDIVTYKIISMRQAVESTVWGVRGTVQQLKSSTFMSFRKPPQHDYFIVTW